MFDGVPVDHFHQFIATASSSSSRTPPSINPFHGGAGGPSSSYNTSTAFSGFELHPNFLHHHPQPPQSPTTQKNEAASGSSGGIKQLQENSKGNNLVDMEINDESINDDDDLIWCSDEVLALLRIRSTMENNCFPEYTWEHVSRKLSQLGFKRSADKCKEKFEEESSRYFNTNIPNPRVNFTDHHQIHEAAIYEQQQELDQVISAEKNKIVHEEQENNVVELEHSTKNNQDPCEVIDDKQKRSDFYKKRKNREKKKFEMFKCFCEDIVHKMMAQQEEMHSKIIEDMVRRDEEKLAREEEWKVKEMERFDKEIELRAKEQVVLCDRQTAIINFLRSLASSDNDDLLTCLGNNNGKKSQPLGTNSSSCNSFENCQTNKIGEDLVKVSSPISSHLALNPNHVGNNVEKSSSSSSLNPIRPNLSINHGHDQNPTTLSALALVPASQNPNPQFEKPKRNPNSSHDREDIGKRWPRDEVLALINIRSNLYNINGEEKEGGGGGDGGGGGAAAATTTASKAPLWVRISQGMLELGYKRSAKRCKEKWENINKYFRKTKDVNKKRSLDSRTCPYFQQLSTLYNQGTLLVPPAENHLSLPESGSGNGGGDRPNVVVGEGEKQSIDQAQGFEFEF